MNYLNEVKLWSEEKVGEWLKSNNFGDYVHIFKGCIHFAPFQTT